ncbi:MAG: excinuclease ABC subunit A [Acidobacteria bacterium]|nr:MAG: excinuclease ABC subunit A [Acidobacteriota bacterium]PYU74384.1 MAG: excinuclease ABC subunit A [Acidobacteriota bacterium]
MRSKRVVWAFPLATKEITHATTDIRPEQESIRVRGARVHNLKNISVEIPHNAITVVTGVSGSGKSSLAFDTIYAEGQRRYVESLSAYARQFLERMEKPDVEEISGIAPAVAIRQKNSTRNPRSNVATATEIYDYLRLLFARCGQTLCIKCGAEVRRDSPDEIATRILSLAAGRRFYVLHQFRIATSGATAVSKRGAKKPDAGPSQEQVRQGLVDLQKRGFNRLYQAGRIHEFSSPESLLDVEFSKPVYVLVDRLAVSPESRARLVDSIEVCYREGQGEAILEFIADGAGNSAERLTFNERFECKNDGILYQEPEPRLFSFNNPYGACSRCQGFGNTIDFDLNLVVPDPSKSLDDGAIEPWAKPRYRVLLQGAKKWARGRGIPTNVPWRQLTAEQRRLILDGDAENDYEGVKGFFNWLERKKYKLHVRVFLSRFRGYATCPECGGTRLRAEARAVRVAGKPITEVSKLTVKEARAFFSTLQLSEGHMSIADRILEEIRTRLQFLDEVGLDYLTLDRLTSTLSGGESQRIQLATSLGSHLVGALYVLDEPSIGLHPRDTQRLIDILKSLRDLGNTVLVVEHDPDTIQAADYVIDLGPGAGELGGKLLFAGSYAAMLEEHKSLTGRYLSGELRIPVPNLRHKPTGRFLRLYGASLHNLQDLDLMIPLGTLTVVTGVSGSGKSTLVHDVLYKALTTKRVGGSVKEFCERLEGDAHVQEVVIVDQSPIGRTPRSNPATYLKAFDAIREVFADTPDSKRRGYAAGHFSFNVPGGRCETCQGDGTVTVEMQFLADVELVCEECRGTRFKSGVLEVRYHGKNIHEVLQFTVREALAFFVNVPKIVSKLRVLNEIGLGYLRLGQSATTLSGGEAQRLKLAAHLSRTDNEGILYILDEPTTGLHFDDIAKLLSAFRKLLEGGASLLVIEHNLEVIKSADWLIDMGPEGGDQGGKIIATGTPEQVARNTQSHTGHFLARVLNGNGQAKRPANEASKSAGPAAPISDGAKIPPA